MKRPPHIVVQLVHLHGPMKGQIQEFSESVIAVGRHPSCALRFPPEVAIVSRKHAEIVRDGNRFKLIDLSANGTFVNGKRVQEAYLKNGDVLTFAEGGPKVSFLTQMRDGSSEIEYSSHSRVSEPFSPPGVSEPPTPPRVGQSSPEPGSPAERQDPRAAGQRLDEPRPRREKEDGAPSRDSISVETVNVPLVFQYGPTLRSFKQLPVTIGRHANCQVRLDHPAVLDMHVQIFYSQNQYWVKDLTGRGLVLVNGEPVKTQAALATNDELALSAQGPVFRFLGEGRFAEEESLDASACPPGSGAQESTPVCPDEKSDQGRKSIFRKFFH